MMLIKCSVFAITNGVAALLTLFTSCATSKNKLQLSELSITRDLLVHIVSSTTVGYRESFEVFFFVPAGTSVDLRDRVALDSNSESISEALVGGGARMVLFSGDDAIPLRDCCELGVIPESTDEESKLWGAHGGDRSMLLLNYKLASSTAAKQVNALSARYYSEDTLRKLDVVQLPGSKFAVNKGIMAYEISIWIIESDYCQCQYGEDVGGLYSGRDSIFMIKKFTSARPLASAERDEWRSWLTGD